jgi:hypothetical protein
MTAGARAVSAGPGYAYPRPPTPPPRSPIPVPRPPHCRLPASHLPPPALPFHDLLSACPLLRATRWAGGGAAGNPVPKPAGRDDRTGLTGLTRLVLASVSADTVARVPGCPGPGDPTGPDRPNPFGHRRSRTRCAVAPCPPRARSLTDGTTDTTTGDSPCHQRRRPSEARCGRHGSPGCHIARTDTRLDAGPGP